MSTLFLFFTPIAIAEHLLLLVALIWIALDHVCILSLITTAIICQLCDFCYLISTSVNSGFLLTSDSLAILDVGLC